MSASTTTTQEVVTFGCRLNAYESEVMRASMREAKLDKDTVVFNTCAVTKEAERQARQAIRRARQNQPDARIIVTGCAAQINPDQFAAMPEVDQVLGNEEKLHASFYTPSDEKIRVNDIMSMHETAAHYVKDQSRARAFVQVQNGCNHRCTFCIIPYGRGNSRSVPMGEIVKHVRHLVEHGHQEIVLTGVDISAYGEDLPGSPTLGQMMKRLLAHIPELPRLRLSSIDVAEVDDDIMALVRSEPRFMPYFHISLQSGDDMILKRMKRRHTRDQVIQFCEDVRRYRPDAAFGADIITGFPTETATMFEETLNLVRESRLHYLHVFPYSEREGTPAAKMPQLPKHIRKARAASLRRTGEIELGRFRTHHLGTKQRVIVEKNSLGRCENFMDIKLLGEITEKDEGTLRTVYVFRLHDDTLYGHLIA